MAADGADRGNILTVGISVKFSRLCAVQGARQDGSVGMGDQLTGIAPGHLAEPVALPAGPLLMVEREEG